MKAKQLLYLSLILLLFFQQDVFAQNKLPFVSDNVFKTDYFIENKGQYDHLLQTKDAIHFFVESGSTQFYFTNTGIHIVLHNKVLKDEKELEKEEKRELKSEEEEEGEVLSAKEREEEEERKFKFIQDDIQLQWLNTNPHPIIEKSEKSSHYFSYGNEEYLSYGYKKVMYKNIYNHIDLVYVLPTEGGIKYSFILHPGAVLADIKYTYKGEDVSIQKVENSLIIKNNIEDIFDKNLLAFTIEGKHPINITYTLSGKEIGFISKEKLSITEDVMIDPWIGTITTLSSTNGGYDVDFDYSGNLYVYGGGAPFGGAPFKVAKYSSGGALLWTFLGTIVSPSWSTTAGGFNYVGNFVVNRENGKIYIGQGLGIPASLIRLRTDAIYDSFLINVGSSQFEIWEMNYVCSDGSILNMGGSTGVYSSIGSIDTTAMTCTMHNITGFSNTDQDILSSALDPNSNLFVEMASVVDPLVDNHIMKVNSTYTSVIWRMPTGYLSFNEADNKPFFGSGTSNGYNALAANTRYVFYYDGIHVKAFNSLSGVTVGIPVTIPGYTLKQQGGIFADECDHVFVGGTAGNVKVYTFDGLNFLPEPDIVFAGMSSRHVYDLKYDVQSDMIYVSGDNFIATASTGFFCSDTGLHVHSGALCPTGAYAYVDAYDASATYTYIWTDSTTGTVIREVDAVSNRSDSIDGLSPGRYYTVTVIENSRCLIKKIVQFVTPTGTIVTKNLTLCPGDSVVVGANIYRTTGSYSDTFSLGGICDSVVNTNLVISTYITYSQVIYNCAGISYNINGHTYTASGTYRDTIDRPGVCDSVMITNLIIFPPLIYTDSRSICPGDSVHVGDHYYTAAGSYSDTIHIVGRCDSIINTNVSYIFSSIWRNRFTICRGDTVRIGPYIHTTAGLFYDTIDIPFSRCDSFMQTLISFSAMSSGTLSYSICSGDSIVLGSHVYYTAGTYHDTLHRSGVCDTAFTTTITVGRRDTGTTTLTACTFDSILYAGRNYYRDTTIAARTARSGLCDSITIVNFVFNPNPRATENYTICPGDVLLIRGKSITAVGTYLDTFLTAANCDTIYTYNVTVGLARTYILNAARCDGDSIHIGNHYYFTTGTYRDTFLRSRGCDSILVTNLTIFRRTFDTINRTICRYDSLRVGVHTYRTSGTYHDTLINFIGCDSFVTTVLFVQPWYTSSQTNNICIGDTLFFNGHRYFTTGIYNDTVRRSIRCDSIVTITLNVYNTSAFAQAISICSGDTFYFHGNRYFTGGVYYDTFTNYRGCDSVVSTTLTVKPLLSASSSYTICYEDSFFAHGAWRNRTGVYIDTLISSFGCDSFYSIILTVRPLVITNVNIARCVGDSFLCGGKYQKLTGIYNDTFTNILGCDSILQTNLVMNPATQDTVFKNICITDSFFCAQNYQRTTGIYIDSLINSNGCDSILYTSLVVYNLPLISLTPDTIICLSKSASLHISTNTPCTFQWSNGATTAAILVNPLFPTNYIVTATDSLGCKSKDSVSVDLYPLPLVDVTDTTICFGQSAKLSASGGVSYVWSTGATTPTISMTPANTTSYTVIVTDSNNCKSNGMGIVTVNNLIVNIDAVPDSIIRRGETVVLHAVFLFDDTSIFWTPAYGLSTTDSAYTIANPKENTSYLVVVTDSFGCKALDSISIYIIPEEIVLVPTGFSPNGDGVNDVLNVTLSPNLTLQEFRIYNRWGEEVFNYPKDNRGKGWDGMYKEREQPISTYVWVVVAKNKVSGNTVNRNGNVTLLR